jgi:hypothetical protein
MHSIPELFALETEAEAIQAGPAGPALHLITAAWNAVETLETSMLGGPDRWQSDS